MNLHFQFALFYTIIHPIQTPVLKVVVEVALWLYEDKKCMLLGYRGQITVIPRLEDFHIPLMGEAPPREFVPQNCYLIGTSFLSRRRE